MEILVIGIFILGYLAIVLEHPLQINKSASALLTGILLWIVIALQESHFQLTELSNHLSSASEILFFLLGAMTIVELIDAHQGFHSVSKLIKTQNPVSLLWISGLVTFFLSSILDNLTTAIVMVTLLRKLIQDGELRKYYAGMVIIAANAGGAWSPIGDVTTTMLWIGGQISVLGIIQALFIPSLISLIIPLIFASNLVKNQSLGTNLKEEALSIQEEKEGKIILFIGILGFIFVPIFKTLTHLPPYMGILFVLGIVWVVSELMHQSKPAEMKNVVSVAHALTKIDAPSILFFLGILLAIGSLEYLGYLKQLAQLLGSQFSNLDSIIFLIGLSSAVVDNVPLVAASMGMYDLQTFPMDHRIWEFLAYCAGTGGSILIIGSAAGVTVMGMEKIDFIWYAKKIGWLAFLGYSAGALWYVFVH